MFSPAALVEPLPASLSLSRALPSPIQGADHTHTYLFPWYLDALFVLFVSDTQHFFFLGAPFPILLPNSTDWYLHVCDWRGLMT